jgi:hypothetical protein
MTCEVDFSHITILKTKFYWGLVFNLYWKVAKYVPDKKEAEKWNIDRKMGPG